MKIVEGEINRFLEGKVQYQIPIYQRKYSWEKEHCEKLLKDIIKVAEDEKRSSHFIGSIIYMAPEGWQNESALKKYQVIDGQQRLTTIALLLLALGDYAQEVLPSNEVLHLGISPEAIKEDYLINKRFSDDDYYKLKLTEEDFVVYKSLLSRRTLPDGIQTSRLYENYLTFLKCLRAAQKAPATIFAGINKLKIGDISLVPDDNAQLVFETVNSTGLQLPASDKIRNFILMNFEKNTQDEMYNDYWHPMELRLGLDNFNSFFFYYTSILTQAKMENDYYPIFKEHFLGASAEEMKTAVKDVARYSRHYKRWLDTNEHSAGIDRLLFNIKNTKQWKVTPVIMKVMDNLESDILSVEGAKQILKYIETYILRRQLCHLPSNSVGDAYLSMQRHVQTVNEFIECLHSLTEAQRVPSDEELYRTLKTMPLYSCFSSGLRNVLDRMEAYFNKDYCHNRDHSIEHIMPQKIQSEEELEARSDLSPEEKEKSNWAKDLGEDWKNIHDTYCDTIGNLTLTGYNSPYHNYRFRVKQNISDKVNGICYGYKQTCIHLSASLATKEKWGEEEILARAKEMTDIIVALWPYPDRTAE
mgnify:CR=1 FL=1